MEANCVTLDTAKKLKAAGFPQETANQGWFPSYSAPLAAPEMAKDDGSPVGWYLYEADTDRLDSCAAPDAQEIADQLLTAHQVSKRKGGEFVASEYTGVSVVGPTMAEALAALYLKLQEASHE